MKNIVIIGGGTGTFTLLSGLRKFPSNNTVIVASSDDGGSTGKLRKELGVFPPGDIRQCLVGLSYTDKQMQNLFNYRFEKGQLAGHAVGNLILAALEKMSGSINIAIAQVAKLLNVRGQVLPVTLFPTILSAIYKNGKKIIGEHNIDEPPVQKIIRSGIRSLTLFPNSPANPRAITAIKNADAIIFGPGDLYTSTIPNLLVKGVREAIMNSKSRKILITNIMTKDGQTNDFKASDFVRALNHYLSVNNKKSKLNAVIVNTKKPALKILSSYWQHRAQFVEPDLNNLRKLGIEIIRAPLVLNYIYQRSPADKLKRSFLRHNSNKLASLIWQLIK